MTVFAVYTPEVAHASAGHFVLGGVAGAGIVLAWPTIVAGVGAAAGAIGAAGAAVVGAVGAVGGAVAVGGAAAGGAVAGAGAAVGGAVTAGFGVIGGAIAAITASPLFVPALLIAGAAIAGYFIYKHFKKKKSSGVARISSTASTSTSSKNTAVVSKSTTPVATKDKSTTAVSSTSSNVRVAYESYQAAYKRYIQCLQNDSTGSSVETKNALDELKKTETYYRKCVNK